MVKRFNRMRIGCKSLCVCNACSGWFFFFHSGGNSFHSLNTTSQLPYSQTISPCARWLRSYVPRYVWTLRKPDDVTMASIYVQSAHFKVNFCIRNDFYNEWNFASKPIRKGYFMKNQKGLRFKVSIFEYVRITV